MFFKNAQIFRLPAHWAMTAAAMAEALLPQAFTPASSNELVRQGWASPRGDGQLVHAVGGQWLLQLQTEKKLLPLTVVNQVAAVRAAELEEQQGFAPGKKVMKELKESVHDELLPRAFSVDSTTNVWIDPVHGWLVVDAASATKADEVIKLLLKAVDRMPLESLRVQRSPVGVMTAWLQDDEAPAGFTIDQDAIMRATGESKAQVAYKRHTLEPDDVRRHIAAGKQCTRLAMTWESKISFVLDESLAIKSIKPLDVIKEGIVARDDQERFDGDFALMAGELARLLADLVRALGGEADTVEVQHAAAEHGTAGAGQKKVERAVRLTAEIYKMRETYRAVLNDQYAETIQPVIDQVRKHMDEKGIGAIESALAMAKTLVTGTASVELLLVAAVEIVEPSQPLTKGVDLGNVAAGDGSAADPLYDQAVTVVRANQRASISLVQRHLRIGYNRAARLLEAMELAKAVSPMAPDGSRQILPSASSP